MPPLHRRLDEQVARHLQERVEDPLIADAPRAKLLLDHPGPSRDRIDARLVHFPVPPERSHAASPSMAR